jgi:hypothetical protein
MSLFCHASVECSLEENRPTFVYHIPAAANGHSFQPDCGGCGVLPIHSTPKRILASNHSLPPALILFPVNIKWLRLLARIPIGNGVYQFANERGTD